MSLRPQNIRLLDAAHDLGIGMTLGLEHSSSFGWWNNHVRSRASRRAEVFVSVDLDADGVEGCPLDCQRTTNRSRLFADCYSVLVDADRAKGDLESVIFLQAEVSDAHSSTPGSLLLHTIADGRFLSPYNHASRWRQVLRREAASGLFLSQYLHASSQFIIGRLLLALLLDGLWRWRRQHT